MKAHRKAVAAVVAIVTALGFSPAAADSHRQDATIEDLVRTARSMNPEAVAMALEADAAEARADAAGSLDDPTFETEVHLFRGRTGYAPSGENALVTYRVAQMFPLWGKRALKKEAAEASGRGARVRGTHRVESWGSRPASAAQLRCTARAHCCGSSGGTTPPSLSSRFPGRSRLNTPRKFQPCP